ncbi:sulfotransferase [Sphingomicrobium sp. B8]|uniref:Sulfotransferase n=2 Tax=Sphingomicrobium clamense TaxID=2851013 RepID=A0ABS6V541_9SPHN|nr:sulfotransferase [Sphingomicrobium sp. B8]MBW0144470.1 sulfotransferase [Sphingomicrobium sp. B8]
MWSGPRNISTAMMRAFSSRPDTHVSDEPFYGAFLKATGEPHPMAAETIADMDCDWRSVAQKQKGDPPDGSAVWYQKHMPHHMVGEIGLGEFLESHRHAFLIRAPECVVASYRKKNELREPEMLGFAQVRDYVEQVIEATGDVPPIVDSDDILEDPETMLRKLCAALGLDWNVAMLSWEEGPHPQDGVWGAHWYDRVNRSTGFAGAPGPMPELEGDYARVAEACAADYAWLHERAIA